MFDPILHPVQFCFEIAAIPTNPVRVSRIGDIDRPQDRPEPPTELLWLHGGSFFLQFASARKETLQDCIVVLEFWRVLLRKVRLHWADSNDAVSTSRILF